VLLRGEVFADEPSASELRTGGLKVGSRREALVGTAAQLFGTRGYHEVSLDDIGAAAGIAGPSVYKHFTTKRELLYEMLNRGANVLQFSLTQTISSADSPEKALIGLIHAYVALGISHTDMLTALVTEVLQLPDDQRHAIRRIQRDYVTEWLRLLLLARPGLDRAEAQLTVHGALAMVNDVLRIGRLRGRPRLADELAGLCRLLLLGDPDSGQPTRPAVPDRGL
jgi:AcrR family transcriptional regulator